MWAFYVWLCMAMSTMRVKANLIANGDFQQYGLMPDMFGKASTFVFSDSAIWYDPKSSILCMKQLSFSTTSMIQFSQFFVFTLCQDKLLQTGNFYQLNFTVINQPLVLSSVVSVEINNVIFINHTTLNSMNITQGSFYFLANTSTNKICLSSVAVISGGNTDLGACVDNITLNSYTPPPSPPPNNNTNTINATTNSFNSTNTTIGLPNLINETNITNTTNATNQANSTNNVTDISNTNNTANTTINININSTANQILNTTTPTDNATSFVSQLIKWFASCALSLPIKTITSLRCAFLVLDDIWLYDYSRKKYNLLMQTIFETIGYIQLLKFQIFDRFLSWSRYKAQLEIPEEYALYSAPRFVEVEGSSSVLLDSNYSFFVYTVPENILCCLILYFLFQGLRQYSISKYIRKFYFIKSILDVALLEENLGYFVFVCFSHLHLPFSFKFADKLELCLTVLFLFGLFLFTFCFYLLIYKYLRKKAAYFCDFMFREFASFCHKTLYLLLRNLLRAVVFCILHDHFRYQLMVLCCIQMLMLKFTIILESSYSIFLSKLMYTVNLSYSFLFVLFNLALLIEDTQNEDEVLYLLEKFQEIIIYCLIGNTILMMVIDFFGLGRRQLLTIQEFQKQLFFKRKQCSEKIRSSGQAQSQKCRKHNNRNTRRKYKKSTKLFYQSGKNKTQNELKQQIQISKPFSSKQNKLKNNYMENKTGHIEPPVVKTKAGQALKNINHGTKKVKKQEKCSVYNK